MFTGDTEVRMRHALCFIVVREFRKAYCQTQCSSIAVHPSAQQSSLHQSEHFSPSLYLQRTKITQVPFPLHSGYRVIALPGRFDQI
jgi:hypothetical protein